MGLGIGEMLWYVPWYASSRGLGGGIPPSMPPAPGKPPGISVDMSGRLPLTESLSIRGGESAMLQIVITRSDAHLREVLRTFERKYHVNFARQALKKSNNLVGEIVAHVLNGALNRPARDAMLLRHALLDLQEPPAERSSSPTKHARQQRWDLLISRLVRLHWEPKHLRVVKREYKEKYGKYVEEDIEDACRGDFGEFCLALLEV